MKHHREKILWITAQQVKKVTGFTHEDMRALRENNPMETGFYKLAETNGYLYNSKMLEPIVKKQIA